jgi:putative pyruvate formate lyase activating enzyme
MMKDPLENYKAVLSKKQRPRFMQADLNHRISKAREIIKRCEFCERKCMANRSKGETGFCQVGTKILVSSMSDHWGEEGFLIPSFTIFFWSCTFSCVFCQNWTISQRLEIPSHLNHMQLAEAINSCSCKNINLVGGEPTPYLPMILESLSHVEKEIPLVWNSNFFMSVKSMNLLKGLVDVYLSDFKYGPGRCAERLSGVKGYWRVVTRNHRKAFKDADLVIRHLVLPGHVECCSKPIMDFISKEFGKEVVVNVMDQYRPEYKAGEHQDIASFLDREEYNKAFRYAQDLGLNLNVGARV